MAIKTIDMPHWTEIEKRLIQEQAKACKEFDDAHDELALHHTKLSVQDGAKQAAVDTHEPYVSQLLDGKVGLTKKVAAHCKGYQKALADLYQHRAAKRLAYGATSRHGQTTLGQPLGQDGT